MENKKQRFARLMEEQRDSVLLRKPKPIPESKKDRRARQLAGQNRTSKNHIPNLEKAKQLRAEAAAAKPTAPVKRSREFDAIKDRLLKRARLINW
jgi:hypothetical protein